MATVTGTQISDEVGYLLNDTTSLRWTAAERLLWINDGRREMFTRVPSIFGGGTEVTHTLANTSKQTLTNNRVFKFISLDYNISSGISATPTTRAQLDAFKPAWRNDVGTDVQNWFPDESDPLSFCVYPKATGNVMCHAYIEPTDITALSDVAVPFDVYKVPLVNYVCFRAYAKEDEVGAGQKALAFYELFKAGLE